MPATLPDEVMALDSRIKYLVQELMPSLRTRLPRLIVSGVKGLGMSWAAFLDGTRKEGYSDERKKMLILFDTQREALDSEIKRITGTGPPSAALQDMMGQKTPSLVVYSFLSILGGLALGSIMAFAARR